MKCKLRTLLMDHPLASRVHPSVKETVYYSKHKTYKSETLHIILNMYKHYNRIVQLKLRLLEEPCEKNFCSALCII